MLRRGVLVILALAALSVAPAGVGAQATLTVDTFADTYDGSCADGDCSLRDAISMATWQDVVDVPSGFYALTTTEAGGPGDGSIDITSDIDVRGIGETGVFIDASALGAPMFHIAAGGDLRLHELTLFGATTDVGGPALWIVGGRAHLRDVTITSGRGERAGAVVMGGGGTLVVVDTLFLDNRSSGGAGAVWTSRGGGSLTARDSAFVGNRGERGGAIDGRIGSLTNVTLHGNVARRGGGAVWPVIAFEMRHVTIAGNRAEVGAAIAIPRAENGHTRAALTIIAGNRSARGGQCAGLRLLSLGGNVEDGASCGFSAPSDRHGDPRLGPLTSNGGPTPTAALAISSPAIDITRGDRSVTRDQRGAPRDGRCDAGAYERVLCRGRAVDIVGTPGEDELSGGREDDTFLGLGGDDEFQGSLGRDIACGGPGDDHLLGGPGDDLLVGSTGRDLLDGEDGTDRCMGGPGRDELTGCEI